MMGPVMPRMHRPRLLPATIATMALLLLVKSATLVWAATAETPTAPPPPAAKMQAGAPMPAPMPAPMSAPPPAPAAKPVDPPMSEAERGLLLDLRHRRAELDARARALDQRDAVMAAAQARLSARVDELTALQAKLEALETARQSHDSANWVGLVHVYETMKPRDAATIFDALDMQVLLPVLDRMSDRKAAPILAAMQPDRARLATQLLAELRTKSITPAGEKPVPPADPKG
jgi:flagellar motility protein MotE (MotC chaperone)